jgi:hypothetical protein
MVALARTIAVTEDDPMVFRVETVLGHQPPILTFGHRLGLTVFKPRRQQAWMPPRQRTFVVPHKGGAIEVRANRKELIKAVTTVASIELGPLLTDVDARIEQVIAFMRAILLGNTGRSTPVLGCVPILRSYGTAMMRNAMPLGVIRRRKRSVDCRLKKALGFLNASVLRVDPLGFVAAGRQFQEQFRPGSAVDVNRIRPAWRSKNTYIWIPFTRLGHAELRRQSALHTAAMTYSMVWQTSSLGRPTPASVQ